MEASLEPASSYSGVAPVAQLEIETVPVSGCVGIEKVEGSLGLAERTAMVCWSAQALDLSTVGPILDLRSRAKGPECC